MAWSDPNNKSFFTTGWQLFTIGLFAVLGSAYVFEISEGIGKALAATVDMIGLVLMLAAIFVWIAKLYEKLNSRHPTSSHTNALYCSSKSSPAEPYTGRQHSASI
jgi:hypothetical protein